MLENNTNARFVDKVAIVTGASSGIGEATARLLAQEGARVVLTGRKAQALETLAASLQSDGAKASACAADLLDPQAPAQIVAHTINTFGSIDILVNAAGIIGSGTLLNTELDDFQNMFALNVTAPFLLMKEAMPHLLKTKGAIVNVSSVTGLRAFPGVLSYCASKAALDHMTRCVALEVAPQGVRVNAVNPGVVVTQLHRRGGMNDDAYQAFLQHSQSTHPMGRVGQAEEIAAFVAFLASKDAGWITGLTSAIDGGRALTCAR